MSSHSQHDQDLPSLRLLEAHHQLLASNLLTVPVRHNHYLVGEGLEGLFAFVTALAHNGKTARVTVALTLALEFDMEAAKRAQETLDRHFNPAHHVYVTAITVDEPEAVPADAHLTLLSNALTP